MRSLLYWSPELYIPLQFCITYKPITLYTWLFLVPLSKQVVDREESKTILQSPKGVPGTSQVTWWLKRYFRKDAPELALLLLLRRNYFAVHYETSRYLELSHCWTRQSWSISAGCWDDTLASVGSPWAITIAWWIRGYFIQALVELCTSAYWYLKDYTL